jgi:hypothetical protein
LSIRSIGVAKLLEHPALLDPKLAPERERHNDYAENASPFSARNGEPDSSEQQASVDRMTNYSIRSAGDQLVFFLERNGSAPISPEVNSRPNGKEQASQIHDCTDCAPDAALGER